MDHPHLLVVSPSSCRIFCFIRVPVRPASLSASPEERIPPALFLQRERLSWDQPLLPSLSSCTDREETPHTTAAKGGGGKQQVPSCLCSLIDHIWANRGGSPRSSRVRITGLHSCKVFLASFSKGKRSAFSKLATDPRIFVLCPTRLKGFCSESNVLPSLDCKAYYLSYLTH